MTKIGQTVTKDDASADAVAILTDTFNNVDVLRRRPVTAMTYAEIVAAAADTVEGHELEKVKANLVGVPFVITGITYRDGVLRNKTQLTNYVSVEIVVADQATLDLRVKQGRITAAQMMLVIPEDRMVINDGSTGICRQLTAYLHGKGLIQVPAGPEAGASGECRYDIYRAEWLKGYSEDADEHFDVILNCPRGLRVSEYETDYSAGEAVTYYLA